MSRLATDARRQRDRILEVCAHLDRATLADMARRGRHTAIPDGFPTSVMSDGMPRGISEYVGVEAHADRRGWAGTGNPERHGVPSTAVARHTPDPTGVAIAQLFRAAWAMGGAAETIMAATPGWMSPPWPGRLSPETSAERAVTITKAMCAWLDDNRIGSLVDVDPTVGLLRSCVVEADRVNRLRVYVAHVGAAAETKATVNTGECQACRRMCWGPPNDRIRKGYCHTCFTAWMRTAPEPDAYGQRGPRQDRAAFERERRLATVEADEHSDVA